MEQQHQMDTKIITEQGNQEPYGQHNTKRLKLNENLDSAYFEMSRNNDELLNIERDHITNDNNLNHPGSKPRLFKPKKPLSAYLLFVKDYKATYNNYGESTQQNEGEGTINLLKNLGEIWKNMTIDAKQKYNDMANKEKEIYEAELTKYYDSIEDEDINNNDNEHQHYKDKDKDQDESFLQLAKIKNIIKSDPDINKIKKDTLVMIAQCSELFSEYLIKCAENEMKKNKKKKLVAHDLAKIAQEYPVFKFLDEANIFDLQVNQSKGKASLGNTGVIVEEPLNSQKKEKASNLIEKPSKAIPVKNNHKISDFFAKK